MAVLYSAMQDEAMIVGVVVEQLKIFNFKIYFLNWKKKDRQEFLLTLSIEDL